jgi:hypothetical protein
MVKQKNTLLGVERALTRSVSIGRSTVSEEQTRRAFEELVTLLRRPGLERVLNLLQSLKQHNVKLDAYFIGERKVWANHFGSGRYKRVIDCVFQSDPKRQFTYGSAMYHTLREGVDLHLLIRLIAERLGWVPLRVEEDLSVRQVTPEEASEYYKMVAALETVNRMNKTNKKNNIILKPPYRLYYLPNTIESRLRLVREMNQFAVSTQPLKGGRTYDSGGLQSCSRLYRAALLHGSNAVDWDIRNTAPALLNWMTGGAFDSLRAVADREGLVVFLDSQGEPVDPKKLKTEMISALNEMDESKMTNDFTRGLAKERPAIKERLLESGWITKEESQTRAAIFCAYTRAETLVMELFKEAAMASGCETLAAIHDGIITFGGDPEQEFKRVMDHLRINWGLELEFVRKHTYN